MEQLRNGNEEAINADTEQDEQYAMPIEDNSQQYLNPNTHNNSKINDLYISNFLHHIISLSFTN